MRLRVLLLTVLLLVGVLSANAQDDGYAEAQRRIEEARLTGATELDLSRLGLTAIPPEIGTLSSLQILSLTHNQLETLPPDIASLTQLRMLSLSSNRLTELPSVVTSLHQLEHLYLGNNFLTELPPTIRQMSSLTILSVQRNRLTRISAVITRLTNLQHLYLGGNRLTSLPPEMGSMTHLQTLSIWENPFPSPLRELAWHGPLEILGYLQDELVRRAVEQQNLMLLGLGGVSLLAAMMLGFRIRQRGGRKGKKKRG
jgi:Leucine-rich repeat (LRR) protein